jgi:hypothetical protein
MTISDRRGRGWQLLALPIVVCTLVAAPDRGMTEQPDRQTIERNVGALIAAYPAHVERIEGNALVWKDGTRMVIDDGRGAKTHEVLLNTADIKDMFFARYPLGASGLPPAVNADPGRARNAPFFDKMYGDCRAGGVTRNLVDVVWLPKKWGKVVKITRINEVDKKLAAVSRELDELPARFDAFLFPSEGTYVCRAIAGTNRVSAHGHGIAIDISTKQADYWRWTRPDANGRHAHKNRIPWEIVEVFERHGFVWGGKWYHYDTMHFEYRPEIIAASK